MKQIVCITCLLIGLTVAQAADKSLPDKLIEVTIEHIRTSGPDTDVAELITRFSHAAWPRREEVMESVAPYLKDKDPAKVAGAIEVLARLRGGCPRNHQGDFEQAGNAEFLSQVDNLVSANFDHYHSLTNNDVFHQLALFLSEPLSKQSRLELRRIATSTTDNEQALICLTFQREPQDMEFLFPFMIADTGGSRSLPYQFRERYGALATPYLKRALNEAKSTITRAEAALELVRLDEEAGFDGLISLVLAQPLSPRKKTLPAFDFIRQTSIDYYALPKTAVTPEAVAAHLERKKAELILRKAEAAKESNHRSDGIVTNVPNHKS